jgi:hypothetical protein
MPAGKGGYDDCVANVGEAWLMPGAQDRWGQLTEPSAANQEAMAADRPHVVDRPERGSLAEMQQRLERLPPGHPSSPYNDDLTRKPPVVRLKDLELPLQGNEHDSNGAATHYEPDTNGAATHHEPETNGAATHYEPDPAEEVPATARAEPVKAEPASSNGTSGRSPAAPSVANWASPGDWASTGEWASTTAGGLTADGLDGLADGRDHAADEPDAHEPDTHTPDTHAPERHEPDSDDHAANGRDAAPDWLSTPAWDTSDLGGGSGQASGAADWNGTASWESPASWDSAPDPDRNGAYQDDEAGPGWTEPESAADTLSHAVIDGGPHREAAAPVTGADGSWQWKGRYLTPDECHVAEEALGRCRIAEGRNVFGGYGHSGLTPAMRRVEAHLEHGSLAPDTENFTLKSADSFKKKLADLILRHPDKSAEELSLEVPDGIRYSFIIEAEHYAEATLQAHSRLKGNGFDLEVRRNCWKIPGYKGINSRWRDPAHDLVFEVQFHTGESWDTWQRAHALYEAIGDLSTPPEQRARLRAIYADMSAAIPVPPGCTAIPDYRQEGR